MTGKRHVQHDSASTEARDESTGYLVERVRDGAVTKVAVDY